MDDSLRPVSGTEPGELLVAGPQTTPGYWKSPEKTAERYVDMPIGRNEVRRFYRTGDRVFRLGNGDLAFLGRTDNQVKILGHRVELAEIEAVLLRDPQVEHAVAVPWPIVEGSAQSVVAFVSGRGYRPESLLEEAKKALPAYMVPREIIAVTEMPLNPNGKVDRRALQERLVKGTQVSSGAAVC